MSIQRNPSEAFWSGQPLEYFTAWEKNISYGTSNMSLSAGISVIMSKRRPKKGALKIDMKAKLTLE
jgi:hypothetical protein